MSHYLVLLILEFLPAWLPTLPYGLDSNVTQLLANMLTKPSVFYYFPIVNCNLVSIKLFIAIIIMCSPRSSFHMKKLIGYADDYFDSYCAIPMTWSWLLQSPWTVTLARLVSGVTFGGWNWMRVRPRLWQSSGQAQCFPSHPPLTTGGTVLKESDDLDILGVIFDSMMTFEKHLARFPEQLLKGWYLEEVLAFI